MKDTMKEKKNKDRILIAKGRLWKSHCRLWGNTEWGHGRGSASLASAECLYIDLEVSLNGDWKESVDAFLHEITETGLLMRGHVFEKALQEHYDTTTRCFHFDHEDYTELVSACSDFITQVLTGDRPLEKAWCKANKKKVIK